MAALAGAEAARIERPVSWLLVKTQRGQDEGEAMSEPAEPRFTRDDILAAQDALMRKWTATLGAPTAEQVRADCEALGLRVAEVVIGDGSVEVRLEPEAERFDLTIGVPWRVRREGGKP